ncbi:Qnr family pentapeptide repeat protein [Candidatus Sodalis endolongispinus]|uniref:Qnr family pentapeptide repeat protein n=1 Tax=Candidatus Sodalis endolongispinus TaxID=2812662 RepID=A0ABS5Y997_9GAMM|nr:Qnr family pentapeptide repeat protein [Candidatus Sodalis endolongispinus]MBT9431234.1 Qnr family pentapeptide repeat protein [Candidatus Sodalis endolongispinus]
MNTITLSAVAIPRDQFTGQIVRDRRFSGCDFSRADSTDSQFLNCCFYDDDHHSGCNFSRALLRDASFVGCDLSQADFRYADALGLEIRECKVQGADFRDASFMTTLSRRRFFCRAYITKSNLSYCNFSRVTLEKCELMDNRWRGAVLTGANFRGADLSGGELQQIDWQAADFTYCDLTNTCPGDLDLCRVNLEGVKLESWQLAGLVDQLGILVVDAP